MRRYCTPERGASTVEWVLILLVYAAAAVAVLAIISSFGRGREPARRASCMNNLKQMGLVFQMYAGESPSGQFPPVALRAFQDPNGAVHPTFNLGPDIPSIYPEYLTDPMVLICPDDPHASGDDIQGPQVNLVAEWRTPAQGGALTNRGNPCTHPRSCINAVDNSYWYFGYALDAWSDDTPSASLDALAAMPPPFAMWVDTPGDAPAQAVALFEELLLRRALPALEAGDAAAFNAVRNALDLPVSTGGADPPARIHRLHLGMERLERDGLGRSSEIPVLWDRVGIAPTDFAHSKPLGGNVLYLDGHVAFVRMGAQAPFTPGMARLGRVLGAGAPPAR